MQIKRTILLLLLNSLWVYSAVCQKSEQTMTLEQVIEAAQGKTRRTTLAKTKLTNQYWRYTAFQGQYKPSLTAEATIPNFNRSISRVTQPDGSITFIPQSFTSADVGLRIGQTIPSLGTRIFLYSGLERLDILDGSNSGSTSYFSTPISLGLTQPLFQHNQHKWSQKIEPLIYEESERAYIEEMEEIAFSAVQAFFEYYIAQLDLEAANLDKLNADSLYALSKGRYSVGRIAETDLLQIELTVRSAEFAQVQAKIDLDNTAEELRKLMNIQEEIYFNLLEPVEFALVNIDPDEAMAWAKKNRSVITAFQRRLLEAERAVDEADKNNGVNINIQGQFGLSQTDNTLSKAYQNLLDQERISLSLQLPLADWGRSKAEREIANSQLALTKITLEQEEEAFERAIDIRVRRLALLKNRLDFSKSSYEVAQKRLDITRKRYSIDKVDALDLNQALAEKESARKNYYASLRNYYLGYYEIRGLTLYDFVSGKKIEYD